MTAPDPQIVQPQPVPTSWTVGEFEGPEGRGIAVQIGSPTGLHVFFLPVDLARAIAAQLTRHADQVSSGLILPGGVIR